MTAPLATRPVLVVDDDAKIVNLVRMYLEREGFTVIDARDGRSALAAIARHDPLLVVLDLMLPEIDGLSVLRALRRQTEVPVVILLARGTVHDRIEGLAIGADDFVPKPFSPAELVLRVQRVLARTRPDAGDEGPGALRLGALVLDRQRHQATIDGKVVPLTTAEFRLLTALLEADGRVLSRDQLLDAMHGLGERDVLDRVIDAHVRRLRDKLGDSAEQPRYVAAVRGVGYRAARASG
ncbi:MAG: response regulator transcription factor [Chloroflexi bacterium]|nr:response regulator transcription factor [Chloroflexota bacterium]